MDIDQLKTLLALAETRNTSRTAALLYLSQPAVTNRLRVLEREVGFALTQHSGKEVQLTDKGKAFLPYAAQVVRAVEEGMDALRAREEDWPRLTVAASPVPSMYILPGLLQSHKAICPELCMHIRTNHQREVFSLVLDGEVDVGLSGVRFRHPSLEAVKIYEDAIAVVVARDHALAGRQTVLPTDLADCNVVWFDREAVASFWREIEGDLLRRGLDARRNAVWVDSAEAAKSVASSGYAVAFLPFVAIAPELRSGDLVALQAPWLPDVRYEVHAICRKARQTSPQIQEFIDLARTVQAPRAAARCAGDQVRRAARRPSKRRLSEREGSPVPRMPR